MAEVNSMVNSHSALENIENVAKAFEHQDAISRNVAAIEKSMENANKLNRLGVIAPSRGDARLKTP